MRATAQILLFLLAVVAVGQERRPAFLAKVKSRTEFDKIARINDVPYKLPHVLFLIDRKNRDRVYYIDSKRDWHHREFAAAQYLTLESDDQFLKNNYYNPNRRFITGWVSLYTPLNKWTYEFWEGDQITPALIAKTDEILNASFFTKLSFKPNSLKQESDSAQLKNRVLANEIALGIPYQPYNLGRNIGKLRFLDTVDESTILMPTDIPVIRDLPIGLPPVAGVIATQPTTALSHLNILARSWNVPSIYIKNGFDKLRPLDGKWVVVNAKTGAFTVREATKDEIDQAAKLRSQKQAQFSPRFDLSTQDFAGLEEQDQSMAVAYGAKSANLGTVAKAQLDDCIVPAGFTVPFYWYDFFLRENGLNELAARISTDPKMKSDPTYARQQLAMFRDKIAKGDLDPHFKAALLQRVHARHEGKGLFIRSSTNSEDLPNFSGAGLYTTMPNVKGDDAIVDALRKVWASIWNDAAFFAREQAGIDHRKVFMAVLFQEGIDADSAGVMLTTNPFDPSDREATFISAKRGLGIRVVEGKKVPEQLIFHRNTNAIQVLTRSAEDSILTFDVNGGIKEVAIPMDRAVLTNEVIRRLVKTGAAIKEVFGKIEQDIEWAYMKGKVYIVQARPYRAN